MHIENLASAKSSGAGGRYSCTYGAESILNVSLYFLTSAKQVASSFAECQHTLSPITLA